MRKLQKKERMQADSLPEIRGVLDAIVFSDVGEERVGSRKATEGHVINAAILALASMPEAERRASLARGFRVMNRLLAMDQAAGRDDLAALLAGTAEAPADVVLVPKLVVPEDGAGNGKRGAG